MSALIWILLGIAAIVAFFVLTVIIKLVSMASFYRRLFGIEHYRDVSTALKELRRRAAEQPRDGGPEDEAEPPFGALTSRGLAVCYSIVPEGNNSLHHISVSTARGITHSAGQGFVSFIVWRFGLEPTECESWAGVNAYHLEFSISNEREAEFLSRSPELHEGVSIDDIRAEVQSIRERVEFSDKTAELLEEDPTLAE